MSPKQAQEYLLCVTPFLEQLKRTQGGLHPLCRVLNKSISEKALCGEVVGITLFFIKHNFPGTETVYESVPNKFILKIKMQGERRVEVQLLKHPILTFLEVLFFHLEDVLPDISFNL